MSPLIILATNKLHERIFTANYEDVLFFFDFEYQFRTFDSETPLRNWRNAPQCPTLIFKTCTPHCSYQHWIKFIAQDAFTLLIIMNTHWTTMIVIRVQGYPSKICHQHYQQETQHPINQIFLFSYWWPRTKSLKNLKNISFRCNYLIANALCIWKFLWMT